MGDTTKSIVYTEDTGNVALIRLTTKTLLTIEEAQARDVPAGKTSYIVNNSDINVDYDFRDAWTYDSSSGFGIDMTKAKNIHRDNIRTRRAELMPALDVEFQKAQETSADTSSVIAKKNALRDAPANSAINSCTTTDELKAQWDDSILGSTIYS
ncbi:hypothetical protein [uncultured Mediterranean phage uvMED]|nr:hypothetical protein [uncultured Mediterranean phage uvMED]